MLQRTRTNKFLWIKLISIFYRSYTSYACTNLPLCYIVLHISLPVWFIVVQFSRYIFMPYVTVTVVNLLVAKGEVQLSPIEITYPAETFKIVVITTV